MNVHPTHPTPLEDQIQDALDLPTQRPSSALQERLRQIPAQNPLPPASSWTRWLRGLGWFLLPTTSAITAAWIFLLRPSEPTDRTPKDLSLPPRSSLALPPSTQSYPADLIPKGSDFQASFLYASPSEASTSPSSRTLRPGAILYPGDLVQFTYQTSRPIYLLLAGVDHKGDTYALWPRESPSLLLSPGKGALPSTGQDAQSFQLDDALGRECYAIIARNSPFSFASIRPLLLSLWKQHPDTSAFQSSPQGFSFSFLCFEKKAKPLSSTTP